jgi:hypothetical protein
VNNKLIFISRLDREAKEFQSRKKKMCKRVLKRKFAKRVSRREFGTKKSFQKRIWHKKEFPEVKFAKEVRKRKFCQTIDDAIAHANGPHGLLEEKQARIVVTSAAAAPAADSLVLLALESCKNMRLILAGCHSRRVLFKINRRSTPPSLIQRIPPPQ